MPGASAPHPVPPPPTAAAEGCSLHLSPPLPAPTPAAPVITSANNAQFHTLRPEAVAPLQHTPCDYCQARGGRRLLHPSGSPAAAAGPVLPPAY